MNKLAKLESFLKSFPQGMAGYDVSQELLQKISSESTPSEASPEYSPEDIQNGMTEESESSEMVDKATPIQPDNIEGLLMQPSFGELDQEKAELEAAKKVKVSSLWDELVQKYASPNSR